MDAFEERYEELINRVFDHARFPNYLNTLLYQKRQEGLKKYGEQSFQKSLENCIKSPVLAVHAKEELLDFLNYIGHAIIQESLRNKPLINLHVLFELLQRGRELYEKLENYNNELL